MMNEDDLQAAVAAGIIDAAAADQLFWFLRERQRNKVGPDEEQFRLITGFNDIFVSIACALVVISVGALALPMAKSLSSAHAGILFMAGAAAAEAGTIWALAEYFTRRRRMALPSILLLLAFVGNLAVVCGLLGFVAATAVAGVNLNGALSDTGVVRSLPWAATVVASVAGALIGAGLHWRRFHVPITFAAGSAAVGAGTIALLLIVGRASAASLVWPICGLGLAFFAEAMWFDMRDRNRVSWRTDAAFWLHLLAAPMIVHPLLASDGLPAATSAAGAALTLIVYLLLTLVALAIDRRAIMVSALVYVLIAVHTILGAQNEALLSFGLTALVLGLFLVALSAAWRPLRAMVLLLLPDGLTRRLPPVAAG